jgi:hypothetical protein
MVGGADCREAVSGTRPDQSGKRKRSTGGRRRRWGWHALLLERNGRRM